MVNGISWGVLAFMLMFLVMHEGRTTRGKVSYILFIIFSFHKHVIAKTDFSFEMDQRCFIGLVIHALLTMALIQFPILRLVESHSPGQRIVGIIAAVLQVLSEIIPLVSLVKNLTHFNSLYLISCKIWLTFFIF